MVTIRRFEERSVRLHEKDKIPGNIHPYIGEEVVAACIIQALSRGDKINSTHRGHGHMIVKGDNVKVIMSEL